MGLKSAALAALMTLSLVLPAFTSIASAATGTPPGVLRFHSAAATYNDFQYRYEGVLDTPIRFDFGIDAGWRANTTATIYMPTSDPASVCEGGTPASEASGVRRVGTQTQSNATAFQVGSGRYTLTAAYKFMDQPGRTSVDD